MRPRSVILLCALLLGACQRKAPSPAECVRFSYAELGVRQTAELSARAQAEVNDLIRRCLTVPYDRMLIECIEETRQTRTCIREFEVRRVRRGLLNPSALFSP